MSRENTEQSNSEAIRQASDVAAKGGMEHVADRLVASRCSCGAPEPCVAPRFGGQHVRPEVWQRWERSSRS
jgi:hypothetical protein